MPDAPLSDIATFVAIVDHGSMRAAAAALSVKPPAITYRLNQLERELGVSLLLRTTRSVELTEAGQRLYRRAKPALKEISEALSDARSTSTTPRGTLRIALSHIAFRYTLADHIAEFQNLYPDIRLDLSFDDVLVDLAEGGYHAGVRIGDLLDQTMIAIRLTNRRQIVHVASPAYLDRNGRPNKPEDLLNHQCILYRFGTTTRRQSWEFQGPEGVTKMEVRGNIIVNNSSAQIDAVKQGLGIGWFGEKIVAQEIGNKELEVILADYALERPPFYLYFPKEYKDLKILRILIDFLVSKRPHQR